MSNEHSPKEGGKTQPLNTIEQEIARQLAEGKQRNPLPAITGKWPGDEILEDLLKMLN